MFKIFIDGAEGTTGLVIRDRLKEYTGIEILSLSEQYRKDNNAKSDVMNECDLVFLCLPDVVAKESVSLITNPKTIVIDTSTAHRTNEDWVYGFAEIEGQLEKIKNSKRIANPGCHASGFISLVAPLVQKGIIDANTPLSAFSLTGYTGGGKKMIAEYEGELPNAYKSPRQYGLTQSHKHIPEIVKVCGLNTKPCFCPIVANYPRGMQVTVPLSKSQVNGSINDIKNIYKNYYTNEIVYFNEKASENGFLSSNNLAYKDSLEISVFGDDNNMILVSRFDNLGKGASGASIQNMNIVLGFDQKKGLSL